MDAGTLTIYTIFGQDRRHVVPLFQRPYVWTREIQWEPLWDDIRGVAEGVLGKNHVRPHFLGAIVLDQIMRPTGHVESRWVIDGQQRLTTIQVILEAFADICAQLEQDRYHKALFKLTRNDDPLSDQEDEQFKVWPTNVDQDHFRQVMLARSPAELKRVYNKESTTRAIGHPIADSYLFFYYEILDWLNPDSSGVQDRVTALYEALREKVRMVVIDLGNEDDAQMIFETLNARGSPLLPSDLVKNYLFYRANIEQLDMDVLYGKYWKPFDEEHTYWRKELGPGHSKRARIDLYLQHYLTLKTKDIVSVGHLYQVYQEYASDPDNGSIEERLDSLNYYSEIYKIFDNTELDARFGLFFRRLNEMAVTTAYPFLLELLSDSDEKEEQIEFVLDLIESFLVRRMVCQLPTRAYNRLFIDMLSTIEGPSASLPDRVKEYLLSGEAESNRWPRDPEFKESWMSTPLFNRLRRGRVRMLLEAMEMSHFDPMSEEVELKGTLTIEHIMPQAWIKNWPLPNDQDPEIAEMTRNRVIHTIGNLTLLTKKLNPSVSNSAWKTKRKGIKDHSILTLNRQLLDIEEWNEEQITKRGKRLFNKAKKIWPIP